MKLRSLVAAGAAMGILASPPVQKTSHAAEPVEQLTAFAVDTVTPRLRGPVPPPLPPLGGAAGGAGGGSGEIVKLLNCPVCGPSEFVATSRYS